MSGYNPFYNVKKIFQIHQFLWCFCLSSLVGKKCKLIWIPGTCCFYLVEWIVTPNMNGTFCPGWQCGHDHIENALYWLQYQHYNFNRLVLDSGGLWNNRDPACAVSGLQLICKKTSTNKMHLDCAHLFAEWRTLCCLLLHLWKLKAWGNMDGIWKHILGILSMGQDGIHSNKQLNIRLSLPFNMFLIIKKIPIE